MWFTDNARRLLLDMHIDDWDDRFLSQFDPKELVANLKTARVKALTIPANTHAGLCYWPTQVGIEHRNTAGKDILGQVIEEAHRHNIHVILYYCTIYIERYGDLHPESRMVDASGYDGRLLMNSAGQPRRFSVVCMNHPGYRDFVVAQLEELCTRYDFEGVWPDMTFWPTVCYCKSCQQRYAEETGSEIPRLMDWTDPVWLRFQNKRQEWSAEFTHLVTSTIKRHKPHVTVAHQSQTYTRDWLFGASVGQTEASDWLSSDYYGDRTQLSFYAKLFYGLSRCKPFEHLNSWCYPDIHEHVVQRSTDHLKAIAYSAIMNHGAVAFIDSVDPVGTLNRDNYVRAGEVLAEIEKYEPYMGGAFKQDVAIYYSFDSLFDLSDNPQPVEPHYNFEPAQNIGGPTAHRSAALGAARLLLRSSIPYGVITRHNLDALDQYQLIILPNAAYIQPDEVDALRRYVYNGGSLYASKFSTLIDRSGRRQNFALSDVFGVNYAGETESSLTYTAPIKAHEDLLKPYSVPHPLTLYGSQAVVQTSDTSTIRATITLPYTNPAGTPYSSMLADPPGVPTDHPSIVYHEYGAGRVIYCAGTLETGQHETHAVIFRRLLSQLIQKPMAFEADAPPSVEITRFDQTEQGRIILHLRNFPIEFPMVPIPNLQVRVNLYGQTPLSLQILPEKTAIDYETRDGWLTFTVPVLDSYLMLMIETQKDLI